MDYLTCEQVADITKCSVFHIREAVKRGDLVAYKPAKCYLFTRDDVDAWIKSNAANVGRTLK